MKSKIWKYTLLFLSLVGWAFPAAAWDRTRHDAIASIAEQHLTRRAKRNIARTYLEYSPSQGYLSYREKLVSYYKKYDINVTADDIIITCGGSEAVLFAFMSCLNPGDEIIVPEPAYANYMAFAISAGAQLRTIAPTL